MSKISLRLYNQKIEGMIDSGQLKEAIAHCQYILKTYPKYIETNRLLGKAFLNGHLYKDATDIFQSVLMAVPDDFVSHVGMSIIEDSAKNLDASIWHMERAFEVQPSNPSIQTELLRLYGQRDGVKPPKIRLTRDALVHMYFNGELYDPAIREIHSILSYDPDRPDLQVVLACSYLKVGQEDKSAALATDLIKKYPYCLTALRILVDILPATFQDAKIKIYKQRLKALDPYSAYANGSMFKTNKVKDSSVTLEYLEYTFTAEQPDWLKTMSPPESTDSDIPEWMRAAGWLDAESVEREKKDETNQAEPIAQTDIPDWLKTMTPAESVGDEIPEWLRPASRRVDMGEDKENKSQVKPSEVEGDALAWLEGLAAKQSAKSEELVTEEKREPQTKPLGIEDDTLAWLEGLAAKQGAKPEELVTEEKRAPQAKPSSIDDDTMAWLEGLAAKQGAKPEESSGEKGKTSQARTHTSSAETQDGMKNSRKLRVFLCHSSGDKPKVRDLYQRLAKEPWISPWLDEEDLDPGDDWKIEISKAVKNTDIVIVCLSQSSINKSGYVQREIRFALDKAAEIPPGKRFIIPLKFEECTVPDELSQWQWVNYYEDGWYKKLIRALQKRALELEIEST